MALYLCLAVASVAADAVSGTPDGGTRAGATDGGADTRSMADGVSEEAAPATVIATQPVKPTQEASAPPTVIAPPDASPPPRTRYFFHGYDYGSQAIFNPLTNLINRGFDVLQIRGDGRNPFVALKGDDVRNVLDNLAHAYSRVEEEGRWKFTREELLPLSWSQETMRWVPNYALHLVGGGMTYTALREWYEDHGVPWSALWSALTVMSSALINESLENKGVRGRNTDCIADIYFFDLGGTLFFSIPAVNRFFSETVVVSDWSMQPGLTWPGTALHNQGNYFALKYSLPFYPTLRLFGYVGLGSMFGLSYRFPSGLSWSVGGGLRSTRMINRSQVDLDNGVALAASAGMFVDRNESLLASLVVSNVIDYFISFNMYPNAILRFEPGVGLWSAISKNGHFLVGISVVRAFGLGAGVGTVYR